MKKISVVISILTTILFSNNVFAEYYDFSFVDAVERIIENNITINTKEIIKLKNIEFDGPNVRGQLINYCVERYSGRGDCVFSERGAIDMGNFKYGNLGGENSYPSAYVGIKGELLAYQHVDEYAPGSLVKLSELLEEKYGKPKVVNGKAHRINTKVYNEQYIYWKDANGTVIVIDTLYNAKNSIMPSNLGAVYILSKSMIDIKASYIAAKIKKERDEQNRKELENRKNL